MTDEDREKMIGELNKNLHEQYANNANTNLHTVLVLVATLLVTFGFYGTVYIGCGPVAAEYDSSDLSFMTMVCFFVLTLIAVICMEVGSSQRSDQFIVENIRRYYYKKEEYDNIFTKGYNPHGKGWLGFLPGLFGVITKVCFIAYFVIFVLTALCFAKLQTPNDLLLIQRTMGFCLLIYVFLYGRYYFKYRRKDVKG